MLAPSGIASVVEEQSIVTRDIGSNITGRKKPHVIDQEKCIQCGTCMDACKDDAVIVE